MPGNTVKGTDTDCGMRNLAILIKISCNGAVTELFKWVIRVCVQNRIKRIQLYGWMSESQGTEIHLALILARIEPNPFKGQRFERFHQRKKGQCEFLEKIETAR